MAKVKPLTRKQKQTQRFKENPGLPGAPFNPMASRYKTNRDFGKAVNRRAKTQIQPQLQDVRNKIGESNEDYQDRMRQIGGFGGNVQKSTEDAYNRTLSSLNTLIATRGGLNEAATGNLQAALNTGKAAEAQAAAQIGGVQPTYNPDGMAATISAVDQGSRTGTLGAMAGVMGEAAGASKQGALWLAQAGQAEQARHLDERDQLRDARSDLYAQIPALREQTRGTMMGEETQRKTAALQNRLARDEFGLKKESTRLQQRLAEDEFDESKRSTRTQERLAARQQRLAEKQAAQSYSIDQANVDIQRSNIDREIAAAGDADKKAAAELKGKRWDNGVSAMQSFLAPSKQEESARKKMEDDGKPLVDKNGKTLWLEDRSPTELYRILTQRIKLPPTEAVQMMMSITGDQGRPFVKWAQATRRQLKGLRKKGPSNSKGGKGPQNLPG